MHIKQRDEWKIAFRMKYRHFEYNVVPFRLTNAPTIFQHLMHDIFQELLDNFIVCYLNDILTYLKNTKKYEQHIRFIFQKLQEVGSYVKLENSIFHILKVEFLRYIIFNEDLLMGPKKIQMIQDRSTFIVV